MKLLAVLGVGLLGVTLAESRKVFVTVRNGGHLIVDSRDDADNELGIRIPDSRGFVNIIQDDEFMVQMPENRPINHDDDDNELYDNRISIPNNRGFVKINQYDEIQDDELFDADNQLADNRISIPRNKGFVTINQFDEVDNELADNRISIPRNKGFVTINQFDDENYVYIPRQPKFLA